MNYWQFERAVCIWFHKLDEFVFQFIRMKISIRKKALQRQAKMQ